MPIDSNGFNAATIAAPDVKLGVIQDILEAYEAAKFLNSTSYMDLVNPPPEQPVQDALLNELKYCPVTREIRRKDHVLIASLNTISLTKKQAENYGNAFLKREIVGAEFTDETGTHINYKGRWFTSDKTEVEDEEGK